MASVNISVKREAYDFLRKMKADNKSFSDVILGFKKEQKSVLKFFGSLKEEARIKGLRDSFDKRLGAEK